MLFLRFYLLLYLFLRSIARPYYLLSIYFATLSFFAVLRSLPLRSEAGIKNRGGGLLCIIGYCERGNYQYPADHSFFSFELFPQLCAVAYLYLTMSLSISLTRRLKQRWGSLLYDNEHTPVGKTLMSPCVPA
jgi:hypothetical protein